MIGSFLTRGLVLIFGYIYPAYECFKTVEMNKPDIDQLRFWCQYWILVAGLTVCERLGDMFISWVPMYGEAKLAFFIYLWFPKTKGTTYVYDSFFRPYVAKHEPEIDRNLLELRIRAGDVAVSYWQKVAIYGQTRIFDILQYIASQSSPPQPAQQRFYALDRSLAHYVGSNPYHATYKFDTWSSILEATRVQKPRASSIHGSDFTTQPSSPASEASTSEQQEDSTEEAKTAPTALSKQKTTPTLPLVETAKSSTSSEVQVMHVDTVTPEAPPPQEVIMEETVRVTRARSRRTRPPPSDH